MIFFHLQRSSGVEERLFDQSGQPAAVEQPDGHSAAGGQARSDQSFGLDRICLRRSGELFFH